MVKNNFYLISLAVIVLDQILKFLLMKNIAFNQSIPVIKNVFHITLMQNYGAGFGILQGFGSLFIWVALVVLGLILFYWDKIKTNAERICMALIVGGLIGNLIDRIIFGYVIDFIDFRIWPVFNIADSAMTIGVIGLLFFLSKNK